jgi:ABC-type branched-subunit amino acid transport system substrate-binding protein
VNVHVSLPLTGPRAEEGRDAADGARLALEQAGGRAGDLEVEASFLDDARGAPWDPVAVGANARSAAQDSSAVAYIGELDSEPTRASVPITNDAGIVQISPAAGAVDLTRSAEGIPDSPGRYQPSGSPSFARIVPADDVVEAAAQAWADELGGAPVVVDFGQGTPGAEHAVAAELAPDRLPSTQTGGSSAPPAEPPRTFIGLFHDRFGREPGPAAAYGYEAMAFSLQAIGEADTDSDQFRSEVRDAVIGGERRESLFGPYSITDEGDSTICMVQRYLFRGGQPLPRAAPCPPG